jgi:hypothetical protein
MVRPVTVAETTLPCCKVTPCRKVPPSAKTMVPMAAGLPLPPLKVAVSVTEPPTFTLEVDSVNVTCVAVNACVEELLQPLPNPAKTAIARAAAPRCIHPCCFTAACIPCSFMCFLLVGELPF